MGRWIRTISRAFSSAYDVVSRRRSLPTSRAENTGTRLDVRTTMLYFSALSFWIAIVSLLVLALRSFGPL